MPLFVVVVAVDPHWLLASLDTHFERVLGPRKLATRGAGHWAATPMNYLEKIFQIPFNIAPMDRDGFGRLVDNLLYDHPRALDSTHDLMIGRDSYNTSSMPVVSQVDALEEGRTRSADSVRLNPRGLVLSGEERAYARQLSSLIPTPRAGKRLINLYRLIRAALPESATSELLATGDYRTILLLLAVLVGNPSFAARLFPAISNGADRETLDEVFNSVAEASGFDHIDVSIHLGGSVKLENVKPWVPMLSRYSFHTGTVVSSTEYP